MSFTREELIKISDTIDVLDFDVPFSLTTDGTLSEQTFDDAYAPDVVHIDVQPEILIDNEEGENAQWEPFTNMSNQDSYHGPVLHASEHISPAMVEAMLYSIDDSIHPSRDFVCCVVEVEDCDESCDDDCLGDHEPAGWVLLGRKMNNAILQKHARELLGQTVTITRINGVSEEGTVIRVDDDGVSLEYANGNRAFHFFDHTTTITSL